MNVYLVSIRSVGTNVVIIFSDEKMFAINAVVFVEMADVLAELLISRGPMGSSIQFRS